MYFLLLQQTFQSLLLLRILVNPMPAENKMLVIEDRKLIKPNGES